MVGFFSIRLWEGFGRRNLKKHLRIHIIQHCCCGETRAKESGNVEFLYRQVVGHVDALSDLRWLSEDGDDDDEDDILLGQSSYILRAGPFLARLYGIPV